jgi:hypothetical protein
LRQFQTKIGVSRLFKNHASPGTKQTRRADGGPVGHISEGCPFVLELRFDCKSFFQIFSACFFSAFLARYHHQPKAPLAQRSPIGPGAGKS